MVRVARKLESLLLTPHPFHQRAQRARRRVRHAAGVIQEILHRAIERVFDALEAPQVEKFLVKQRAVVLSA